ncbi:MAG: rRNA ((967)-C(5))-methyltransferase RsmB [Pseudomonadota bacterium]|jgi:16S rRNA (cytosine967-C5)-methyltransferase
MPTPIGVVNARVCATQILTQVLGFRRSLADILEPTLNTLKDPRDRALAQQLCYGVLRFLPKLQAIAQLLLSKPFKKADIDIECLILIGLYQLLELRIPPHAAISATVDVAKTRQKWWAVKLVNAVLRSFQRQQTDLLDKIAQNPLAQYSQPQWILQQFQQDWAEEWQQLAVANLQQAPMTLRVNIQKIARDDYVELLKKQAIEAETIPNLSAGLILKQAIDVNLLPYFSEGWVSVQDGAAQWAAEILDVPENSHVLDMCAAPAGKMAHLIEKNPTLKITALDKDEKRIQQIYSTLNRLGLLSENVTIKAVEAQNIEQWWNSQLFDRILLDAPCSGSGVIRRHPDIAFLRKPTDILSLVERQKALLNAAWRVLAKGGKLLYATCSVFCAENHLQIEDFLAQHPDATALELPIHDGIKMSVGRQILTGQSQMDGFYYALLQKD